MAALDPLPGSAPRSTVGVLLTMRTAYRRASTVAVTELPEGCDNKSKLVRLDPLWRLAMVAGLASLLVLAAACSDEQRSGTGARTTTPSTASISTSTTVASSFACGTVGFTPQTEDAASDITATGLSCDEARGFVELAGRQTSSGGPEAVEVEGYTCTRTDYQDEPLPRSTYSCTAGSKRVTFVRS